MRIRLLQEDPLRMIDMRSLPDAFLNEKPAARRIAATARPGDDLI
jgi:hypothetical protein